MPGSNPVQRNWHKIKENGIPMENQPAVCGVQDCNVAGICSNHSCKLLIKVLWFVFLEKEPQKSYSWTGLMN